MKANDSSNMYAHAHNFFLLPYFKFIQDNTESKLGDLIHTALDFVSTALEDQTKNSELREAFSKRNLVQCVFETNKLLKVDYLNPKVET